MALDTPNLRGADRLQRRIQTIRARYSVNAVIPEIGQLLKRRILERFDRQVTPDLEPWEPLKPSTLIRKNAQGFGNKAPLVRTGEMRSAIDIIKGGAGTVFTNTGAGLRIGVADPLIAIRAAAQSRGTRTIAARPFLGVGTSDVASVDAFLRRRIFETEAEA